jgi:hypothetical protein
VLAVEPHGVLLTSAATERQLSEAIARPYFASQIDPDTRECLKKLMAAAELVTITSRLRRAPIPPARRSLTPISGVPTWATRLRFVSYVVRPTERKIKRREGGSAGFLVGEAHLK